MITNRYDMYALISKCGLPLAYANLIVAVWESSPNAPWFSTRWNWYDNFEYWKRAAMLAGPLKILPRHRLLRLRNTLLHDGELDTWQAETLQNIALERWSAVLAKK